MSRYSGTTTSKNHCRVKASKADGIGGERPHHGQEVLEHGVIGIAVVGLEERLDAGQGPVAAHVIQQHPEDPAALVVDRRGVAGPIALSSLTRGRSVSACRDLP